MPRVEIHICKLTVNVDHDLKFCLKVKLVQGHRDRETKSLIALQILRGFQSCQLKSSGKNQRTTLPSFGGYFRPILLEVMHHQPGTGLHHIPKKLKNVSTRAPGSRATYHLKFCPFNSKRQSGFCFVFFRGGGTTPHPPPPVFLGFHQRSRFKIGKMIEALTAMVFDQFLLGFVHILLHPQ